MIESLSAVIEKESGGELAIDIYPGGVLGYGRQLVEQIQVGVIEMALVPIVDLREIEPRLTVFDLVFLFDDLAAVDQFQKREASKNVIVAFEERDDLKFLGFAHRGMRQLAIANHYDQVSLPPEPGGLKGLKVRVANPIIAKQFAKLGANPVSLSFAEVYTALQTGVVDATENNWEELQASGTFEIASRITQTNHSYDGNMLIANGSFWRHLPSELRELFETRAGRILKAFNAQKILEVLVAPQQGVQMPSNVRIAKLVGDNRSLWRKQASSIWGEVAPKIGDDLIEAALASNAKPLFMSPAVFEQGPPTSPKVTKFIEEIRKGGPFWNAWFEHNEEPINGVQLKTNEAYDFVLDLSHINYELAKGGLALSTPIAKGLRDEIERAKKLTVWLRPILIGANPVGIGWSGQRMLIKFDRFEAQNRDAELVQQLWQGELSPLEFANRVRAGFVGKSSLNQPLRLQLQTRGQQACGALVLSIWDKTGKVPLSHLVHRFKVESLGSAGQHCLTDEQSQAFESGFRTLLATAIAKQPDDAPSITAALHIFEFEEGFNKKTAFAIFARASASDNGEPEIRYWRLRAPVSEYFETFFYSDRLEPAQTAAATVGARSNVYADVACDLKDYIFGAVPKQKKAAEEAFEMLKAIVRKEKNPTLLARLVASDGKILYLPLRLLSAGGPDHRLIEKPFTLIQPLPRERYDSGRTCVELWALGLPTGLNVAPPEPLRSIVPSLTERDEPFNPDPSRPWLRSLMLEFKHHQNYFSDPAPSPKSEGLLLIAHHGRGGIWFEDPRRNVLTWGKIQHRYRSGSAAILATCEAADVNDYNRRVLEQLNELGVDTVIASPFKINKKFGVELGRKLARRIAEFRDRELKEPGIRAPTLAALFEDAAIEAAKVLNGKGINKKYYDDMRLEFQILGDHGVKLCPHQ
jgi:C4-dicarboxylate-binding protein DctP